MTGSDGTARHRQRLLSLSTNRSRVGDEGVARVENPHTAVSVISRRSSPRGGGTWHEATRRTHAPHVGNERPTISPARSRSFRRNLLWYGASSPKAPDTSGS